MDSDAFFALHQAAEHPDSPQHGTGKRLIAIFNFCTVNYPTAMGTGRKL